MIIPEYIKQGDTIGIVAPARKVNKNEILPAEKIIERWGCKVKLSKNLFGSNNQASGTDEERAEDINEMIYDENVKVILAARGGYGCVHLLDKIDFRYLQKKPKWIAGFSDITALHSAIHNIGIASLHSPMAFNFVENNESISLLKDILFGKKIEYKIKPTIKKISGIIVGGNLSVLYSLRGTKYDIDTNGKILFIEEIDEYLYHIDRMMQNLKIGGKFENLKALIIGNFTKMHDNEILFGKNYKKIISDICKDYDFPIVFDFPTGHSVLNTPIILGKKMQF